MSNKPRRRQEKPETIAERLRMKEEIGYLRSAREAWDNAESAAEEEIRKQIMLRVNVHYEHMMDSVLKEHKAGRPKSAIAEVMGITRQTLDRWMNAYMGRDDIAEKVDAILNPPPPRYSIESNTYDTRPPHMQFQITDNETGKTEKLEPQHPVGNWKFGKLETVRGDEIPAEVMALVPDTEEEAYAMADEKTQLFWRRNWSTTLKLDG